MTNDQTKILVVGCGSIGQRHARLLAEREDVAISLCDTDGGNLDTARMVAPGATTFERHRAALADEPDAVFVCTPNRLHAPITIEAMEAGADVFCEKPIADQVVAGESMVAASDRTGRLLHVGYVMRMHPMAKFMREMVDRGAIGQLVSGRAMVGTYYTLQCARTPYRLEESNALIYDYTHELDLMALFFGSPRAVVATKAVLGNVEIKPEPNLFALIVTFESGAVVTVHMDYIQLPQRRWLELYGDRGTLAGDFTDNQCRHYEYGNGNDGYHAYPFTLGRDDLYRAQIEEFLKAVRTTRQPVVSGREALQALRLAEAGIRSADDRAWVDIGES